MAGGSAEDFPPVPSVDDGFALKLDPKQFKRAVSQVEFAAAADDTRPSSRASTPWPRARS